MKLKDYFETKPAPNNDSEVYFYNKNVNKNGRSLQEIVNKMINDTTKN